MNPLTNIKNINKLNEIELTKGYVDKKSWHDIYRDSAWIFIGGLPYDLTEGDILCVFSQYGEIVNINLVRDKKTGKSKGFCFLCYANQKSTVLAVDNLNGIKLLNRTIRVDHVSNYKPPKDNENDDDVTKLLKAEGCAPKPIKQESSLDEVKIIGHKKKKKEKKAKKEKKKNKKRKTKQDSVKKVKVKQEKIDPGYSRHEIPGSRISIDNIKRHYSSDSESSSPSSEESAEDSRVSSKNNDRQGAVNNRDTISSHHPNLAHSSTSRDKHSRTDTKHRHKQDVLKGRNRAESSSDSGDERRHVFDNVSASHRKESESSRKAKQSRRSDSSDGERYDKKEDRNRYGEGKSGSYDIGRDKHVSTSQGTRRERSPSSENETYERSKKQKHFSDESIGTHERSRSGKYESERDRSHGSGDFSRSEKFSHKERRDYDDRRYSNKSNSYGKSDQRDYRHREKES